MFDLEGTELLVLGIGGLILAGLTVVEEAKPSMRTALFVLSVALFVIALLEIATDHL